jgi:hypothetical protein
VTALVVRVYEVLTFRNRYCCPSAKNDFMNSLEIESSWSLKSPLALLFPPGQRPYGPAAKEG